jgi:hypothetical protein
MLTNDHDAHAACPAGALGPSASVEEHRVIGHYACSYGMLSVSTRFMFEFRSSTGFPSLFTFRAAGGLVGALCIPIHTLRQGGARRRMSNDYWEATGLRERMPAVSPESFAVHVSHPFAGVRFIGRVKVDASAASVLDMLPFHNHGLDLLQFGSPKNRKDEAGRWEFSAPSDSIDEYIVVRIAFSLAERGKISPARRSTPYATRDGDVCSVRAYLHCSKYRRRPIHDAVSEHPCLRFLTKYNARFCAMQLLVDGTYPRYDFGTDSECLHGTWMIVTSTNELETMRVQKKTLWVVVDVHTDGIIDERAFFRSLSPSLDCQWTCHPLARETSFIFRHPNDGTEMITVKSKIENSLVPEMFTVYWPSRHIDVSGLPSWAHGHTLIRNKRHFGM